MSVIWLFQSKLHKTLKSLLDISSTRVWLQTIDQVAWFHFIINAVKYVKTCFLKVVPVWIHSTGATSGAGAALFRSTWVHPGDQWGFVLLDL